MDPACHVAPDALVRGADEASAAPRVLSAQDPGTKLIVRWVSTATGRPFMV